MSLSFNPNAAGSGASIQYNNTDVIFINGNGAGFRDNLASGMSLFHLPTQDGAYRDQYRAGLLHGGFNQQWGGGQWGAEMVDGATGQLYKIDVATGLLNDGSTQTLGNTAGTYFLSQGFVASDTMTLDSVWLKLYKVGNPTGNLTVRIYTNNSGSPNAAIGSASTLSCKLLTSKTDGEFCRVSGLAASLTAGTAYHVVATLGTTDASNYTVWKGTASGARTYPFGYLNSGTSTPAWTPASGFGLCFLIENPTTSRLLQSGGQFDSKFVFGADTYPSQIKALQAPLSQFFDGKEGTLLFRGKGTKGKPIADLSYGIDHDRILVSCNASTGYAQVDVWDSAGTKRTVTGTTDVSAAFSDVAVYIRSKGDGSDAIKLFVNGVSQGTPLTSLTLSFDPLMRNLGNALIGAGFSTAPTWTQKLDMSSLPSANGWTWTGTGTEANCMSVSGGKLYQNKNGYGSTDTGYYQKSSLGLSNATGWTVEWKGRVPSSANTANITGVTSCGLQVIDGTKYVTVEIYEYFAQVSGVSVDFTIQGDFKSQEHVFSLQGKGSDYYLFIDGKLVVDGTGKLTNASPINAILFGDGQSASGENADAIWDYVAYSTAGMIIPQAGGELHELAYWSGDKTSYLPNLYNAGTPISIKQFTGQSRNYIGDGVVQREVRRGVTSGPTTTSTTPVLLTDMECYTIGSDLRVLFQYDVANSLIAYVITNSTLDGVMQLSDEGRYVPAQVNFRGSVVQSQTVVTLVGLHKHEICWYVAGGTGTSTTTVRRFTVEARS